MDATHESPNLDFLRAVAVLLVLIFHLFLFFVGASQIPYYIVGIGHWAVLLFFVHTSLVLMFSLERQHDRNPGKPLFLPFMIRRCFRIYPLSLLTVLTVYLLHLPVSQVQSGRCIPVQLHPAGLISNLALTQNLAHQDSIVAPLWSLPYEIQMYLFLPLLFLIVHHFRKLMPSFALWFLAAFAATFSAHFIHLQRLGIYDFLTYAPCFISGIVAYQLSRRRTLQLPFSFWPLAIAMVTFLYLSDPWDIRVAWSACLLIGVLLPQFRNMKSKTLHTICHSVAKYSYGVYLTHFILIWWGFQDLRNVGHPLQWFLFLSATVTIPVLLYHAVEEPMIRLGNRLAKRTSREEFTSPARAI